MPSPAGHGAGTVVVRQDVGDDPFQPERGEGVSATIPVVAGAMLGGLKGVRAAKELEG